jgi:hypothetical protein
MKEKNVERKWNPRSSGWILKTKCTHAGPNGSVCKDLSDKFGWFYFP